MDSKYYKDDLKPILMRYFKQAIIKQQLSNKVLVHAILQHKDPIELLRYLQESRYVTKDEAASLIVPTITDIKEIATQVNYFTRDGSTVTEVIQIFEKLVKGIKAREAVMQGEVSQLKEDDKIQEYNKVKEDNERPVNFIQNATDVSVTEIKTSKVEVGLKVTKGKGVGNEMEQKHNKVEEEGEDGDGDWDVLEESDIHDFEVIEAYFEL